MTALLITAADDTSVASDSLTTLVRDALMEAGIGAAVHRTGTDACKAEALWVFAGIIGAADCDHKAIAAFTAGHPELREEVLGAIGDKGLIAAITGGGERDE